MDIDIKKFVHLEAVEHKCSYCDAYSCDNPIAADINFIMGLIIDGIHLEWGDPNNEGMAWESREGGWQGALVLDGGEIFDQISFYTNSDKLYDDLCHSISDRQWCQRNVYGLLPQEELFSNWEYFSELVKHSARFVFYRMAKTSRAHYVQANSITPHEILDTLAKLINSLNLIRDIPSKTELFRARVHDAAKTYSTIGELGPPPKNCARYSNRMSPAGIPMFYCSMDNKTALMEVVDSGKNPEVATIGEFALAKNVRILDLTAIPTIPGLFNRDKHSIRAACIFLDNFVNDLTKSIKKDGMEHIEYVPSQVVTEYIRHVFRDARGLSVQGILYPSAAQTGGKSCVMFFRHPSEGSGFNDKGTVDQWLSLKRTERKKLS